VRVFVSVALFFAGLLLGEAATAATTLTIATVNNGDMLRMRALSAAFEAENPSITLKWVTLEENMLRQRVTLDIATKGRQFDLVTIGSYEVPIWAARGWLAPLTSMSKQLDTSDYIPNIREALSHNGTLFAAPFYAESSMLFYRTDLARKAGLRFPQNPTWTFINDAAKKMTDRAAGTYGICLRGKAGWGENVALITAIGNSFGARWFDQQWHPQFDKPQWHVALSEYANLLRNYGPPGASSSGFNDNLALFSAGKCAMWLDATVAASFLNDPRESSVAGNGVHGRAERGTGQKSELALDLELGHSRTIAKPGGGRTISRLGRRP
jgi:sorbitol/mannitol transport system substrate-binding protein